jgi:hypothetical protein
MTEADTRDEELAFSEVERVKEQADVADRSPLDVSTEGQVGLPPGQAKILDAPGINFELEQSDAVVTWQPWGHSDFKFGHRTAPTSNLV